MDRTADSQSPENLAELTLALGDADGFMLSVGGTPLAPNPRTVTREGRRWIAAFSSAERAAKTKPADDGILRAPMPLICATGQSAGLAGVMLNPRDVPWMLIEGKMLRDISTMKGSGHPVAMMDPTYPASLLVSVRDDGTIEVDEVRRTLTELRADLVALQAKGGAVQYTRDAPRDDPSDANSAVIKSVVDLIAELRLPVSFVEKASAAQIHAAAEQAREARPPLWRRLRGK